MATRDLVWLVVFDDYDMYQPKISGFKTQERAIKYFKKTVEDNLEEGVTEDDLDLMAHEYGNGVVYITEVEVEE